MKKVIDWSLVVLFTLLAISGIRQHLLMETGVFNAVVERWIWIHTVVAILFTVAVVCHIVVHWPWYKMLLKKAPNQKVMLRRLGVSALDLVLTFLLISGTIVFFAWQYKALGLWHFWLGLVSILLAILHLARRYKAIF